MTQIAAVALDIPEGVEVVSQEECIYLFPFESIGVRQGVPDDDTFEEYQWFNPRHLDDKGFTEEEMESLLADIKDNGLLYPLLCRWLEGGETPIQIIEGERRIICIRRLLDLNLPVWSTRHCCKMPAEQVYQRVLCKVLHANDRQALKIAVSVTDRTSKWSEGAMARLVQRLRRCRWTDEEIVSTTGKSGQWLRDTDRICGLDPETFRYLAEGKVNRTVALILSDMPDITQRHQLLYAAYRDAEKKLQEMAQKLDKEIEKAEEKEELAEAEVAAAQGMGVASQEAEANLELIRHKKAEKIQERQSIANPKAKIKNLRNAAGEVANNEEDRPVATPLRPLKIRKQMEAIEGLIATGGADEKGAELFPVNCLRLVAACYQAILRGEEDIVKVIKRRKQAQILEERRAKL